MLGHRVSVLLRISLLGASLIRVLRVIRGENLRPLLFGVALACHCVPDCRAAAPEKFELKEGDRVVFLGNTLIERDPGMLELMLTMAFPERNVTFRNLGWSGDTVWGESRAGFGTQADGFKALKDQVNEAKPTVIFVGYGNVEAFAGEKGLPKFIEGFHQLLDVLEATKARIVILEPLPQVLIYSPNSNAKAYNSDAQRYAAVMKAAAEKRGALFVAEFKEYQKIADDRSIAEPATANGMDVTTIGYAALAANLYQQLGFSAPPVIRHGMDDDATSALFKAIHHKNELFFHRWRPQNETYLFGFRKHEQGKNAKEVFEFDPLIAAEEKKIAELRVKLAAELKKEQGAK